MKKHGWLTILTALILALGCAGAAYAEIIPPCEPGQQIGYPAVVLCEELTLREKPGTSAKAVKTLRYGDLPIVVGADLPAENQLIVDVDLVLCAPCARGFRIKRCANDRLLSTGTHQLA